MYSSIKDRRECQAKSYRKRYYKNRLDCLNLLGKKCAECGFDDIRALNIDHINGGGTIEYKKFGGGNSYYRKVKELIISGSLKYQLLCSNCNQIKRVEKEENNRIYK